MLCLKNKRKLRLTNKPDLSIYATNISLNNTSNWLYKSNINTYNTCINYNDLINKPTILTTTDTSNISSNVFNYLITGSSNQIYTNAYLASSNYTYNSSNSLYKSIPNTTWNSNGNSIFYNKGYVGIGTNNPFWNLHLHGSSPAPTYLYITDDVSGIGVGKGFLIGKLNGNYFKLITICDKNGLLICF